jgi:small subunit ribosomal protein S20
MANHKSAIKRIAQSEKKRLRNRNIKSSVKTAMKKAISAIESKSPETKELLVQAESAVGKAVAKGIYHKKNGSRKVSRLIESYKKSVA